MGSGTTLVEAKLVNRHAVGVDINPQSVSISETNLQFQCETNSKIFTQNGNIARVIPLGFRMNGMLFTGRIHE